MTCAVGRRWRHRTCAAASSRTKSHHVHRRGIMASSTAAAGTMKSINACEFIAMSRRGIFVGSLNIGSKFRCRLLIIDCRKDSHVNSRCINHHYLPLRQGHQPRPQIIACGRRRIAAPAFYSLRILPEPHFINWQQDPQANYLARLVFPEKASQFRIEVDLVAEMSVLNPFDFFLEPYAEKVPFSYAPELQNELEPYRKKLPLTPLLQKFLDQVPLERIRTEDFLVSLNQQLSQLISYTIRMEPGVQTPEQTLTLGSGSCRDSSWLLVQILRYLGLAARFVSGYLIQLTADQKSLDGPSGPQTDFTDLHAWCEVYLPGAGWIGLDPTSGLFAGEGFIRCRARQSVVSGAGERYGGTQRSGIRPRDERAHIQESPRVTKPYGEQQWEQIEGSAAVMTISMRSMADHGRRTDLVALDDPEGDQ